MDWVNEFGITLSVDARGRHHKGKGKDGGQFIKEDSEGGRDGSAGRTGGIRGDDAGGKEKGDEETGRGSAASARFAEVKEELTKAGLEPLPSDFKFRDRDEIGDYSAKVIAAARDAGHLITEDQIPYVKDLSERELGSEDDHDDGKDIGGSEHRVYIDEENNRVYKITRGPYYEGAFGLSKDAHDYLRRLEIAAQLWPSLGYKFEGVIDKTHKTEHVNDPSAVIATSMNRISGVQPTKEEISEWFLDNGWEPVGGLSADNPHQYMSGWVDTKTGTVISDTHPGNFLKTSAGLVPIDVNIKESGSGDVSRSPASLALYANQIQRECLIEAGDDVDAGLAAAEYILSTDAEGHQHKGSGEGGGQFTGTGGGGTPSNKPKFSGSIIHADNLHMKKGGREFLEKEMDRYLEDESDDEQNDPKFYISKVIFHYLNAKASERKGNTWRFAVEGDKIVGAIRLAPIGRGELKVEELGSVSSGAGKKLLEDAITKAKENGYKVVALESSTSAAGLYEKLGFKPTGVPPGEGTGKPTHTLALSIDAFLAHDIHNPAAQGILNRALKSARGLSASARRDLAVALRAGKSDSGGAIVKFVNKYRLQLAKLLSTTQLAAVLEGAREVAAKVPPLGTVPVEGLLVAEQERIIETARRSPTIVPPRPPKARASGADDSPEEVHLVTIDEAVKELSEKKVMDRKQYDALDAAARAKAFTVAGVDAEETLTKIRDAMAENVAAGADYEAFKSQVLSAVDSGTFLSDAHQETVFRTNVQSAFSDGQAAVLAHPLVRSGFPYSAYDAIHDDRARANHLALEHLGINGTNVYRNDDPVFQLFRPPWDYNDRCSWTPITVRHAAERGIPEAREWLSTGVEPAQKSHVPMPPFEPPPGFQRAVSAAPLSIQLSMQSIAVFSHDVSDEERDEIGRWTKGKNTSAKLRDGRTIHFIPHSSQSESETMVMVDPKKVDKIWSQSDRIDEHGGGATAIAGRREKFKDFLKTGQPIQSPSVYITIDGELRITDGRHRFSTLRDEGASSIGLTVPKDQADQFRRQFGTDEEQARIKDEDNLKSAAASSKSTKPNKKGFFERLFGRSTPALSIEWTKDDYPRNAANQFLDKMTLVDAAANPDLAVALRESTPEEHRWKFDRAIAHIQAGGAVHHPSENPGLAVGADGKIANLEWADYAEGTAKRWQWETREQERTECCKSLDKAIRAVRRKDVDFDAVDESLREAGATAAELRALSRLRYKAGDDGKDSLRSKYEDAIEAIYARLEREAEDDKEPDEPREPAPRARAADMMFSTDSTGDTDARLQLIAEILVLLFKDRATEEAKNLDVALANFNPNEPREPKGIPIGGEWTYTVSDGTPGPLSQPAKPALKPTTTPLSPSFEAQKAAVKAAAAQALGKPQAAAPPTTFEGKQAAVVAATDKAIGKTPNSSKLLNKPDDSKTLQDFINAPGDDDYSSLVKLKHGEDQDPFLQKLLSETGRDAKPSVVSKEDIDTEVALGSRELIRAVSDRKFADQFRNGELYSGVGVYGSGTYVAYDTGDPDKMGADATATIYGSASGGRLRMTLKPDAKVADLVQLREQRNKDLKSLKEKIANSSEGPEKLKLKRRFHIYGDMGRYAALHNYDAIDAKDVGEMVLLNRGMLDVQDSEHKALSIDDLDVALATPKVTKRYGRRPGPGWTPGGTSSRGVQIWLYGTAPGHAAAPAPSPAPAPAPTPTPTPAAPTLSPAPTGAVPPMNPPPTGGARRPTNSAIAAATHAHFMARIATGSTLSPSDKTQLSNRLNIMNLSQLTTLHAALGGAPAVAGKANIVAAVRSIVSGLPSGTPSPVPAPAPAPAPTPAPAPPTPAAPPTPPTPAPHTLGATTPKGALARPTAPTTQKFVDLANAPAVDYSGKNGAQVDPTWSGLDFPGVAPKYGAVVSRVDPATGKVQVLLAKPKNYFGNTSWTWAKGGQDPGFDGVDTAKKEAMEEAGASGDIVGHLTGTYTENSKSGLNAYFIMRQKGPIDDAAWVNNDETAEVKWIDIDQADTLIKQTAEHASDTNGTKDPSFVNWQRDADVLEQAKAALIPGYVPKVNRRVDVLARPLQDPAAEIRAIALAASDGLIPTTQADNDIAAVTRKLTSQGLKDLAGAMRAGAGAPSDFSAAVAKADPGQPVSSVPHNPLPSPPGPPPRPGLIWNPTTHRWILPAAPPPAPVPVASPPPTAAASGGTAPITAPYAASPTVFTPKTSGITSRDYEHLDYHVEQELNRLGLTAEQALQQGKKYALTTALQNAGLIDYSVGNHEVERTLKHLWAQQTTIPIPAQFIGAAGARPVQRGKNKSLPNGARPKLTPDEETAAQKWTSSGFIPWARSLRDTGQPPPRFAKADADLQSAFSKAKVFAAPVAVERHLTINDPTALADFVAAAQLSVSSGRPVAYRGYIATSTDPLPANSPFRGNIEMHINAVHGLDMGLYHHHPHVKELLLNHDSQFKVTSVQQVGGKWVFNLDQLPPASAKAAPKPRAAAKPKPGAPFTFQKDYLNTSTAVQGFVSGNTPLTTPIPGTYGGIEYTLLNGIMEEAGRNNKPPQVVDSAAVDTLVAAGWKEMYRGVNGSQYTDMFKYDPVYKEAGSGARLYGEGTYIQTSKTGAHGYGTDVMRMAIDPKAKIITISSLKTKKRAARTELDKQYHSGAMTNTEYRAKVAVIKDSGRFAALLNYDMIDARTSGYFVLLNRSMAVVQKDNV